jgi:hypothetical protein
MVTCSPRSGAKPRAGRAVSRDVAPSGIGRGSLQGATRLPWPGGYLGWALRTITGAVAGNDREPPDRRGSGDRLRRRGGRAGTGDLGVLRCRALPPRAATGTLTL